MTKTTYQVTFEGKTFTRKSARVYTHALIAVAETDLCRQQIIAEIASYRREVNSETRRLRDASTPEAAEVARSFLANAMASLALGEQRLRSWTPIIKPSCLAWAGSLALALKRQAATKHYVTKIVAVETE